MSFQEKVVNTIQNVLKEYQPAIDNLNERVHDAQLNKTLEQNLEKPREEQKGMEH